MTEAAETMNFLLATWEGGGSVTPVLTVAKKLADRGHRVRVMSDRVNRPETEAAGAVFVPWTRAPSRADRSRESDIMRDWEAANPQEGFLRVLHRIMAGPALAYAEDVIEELQRKPADLVVSNEMLFGVPLGCEALGQRLALLTCNISLFPMEGVPPLGPGLPPARTTEEHALHAQITEASRQMLDGGLPAVNAARAALGLAPLASLTDQHRIAERLLLGTARAFDFAPAELPAHITYVGPQLGDPAWAAPWRSPWDAADPRPLVLVGFSTTFQGHVEVLQRVIDGAADLPLRLLVTLGDTIAPGELTPTENCRLVSSAPHNAVMPEAVLVVTHGGHGTVTRALMHGKPLVVVPHGRDQADNAVRVTTRGAGLMVPADSDAQAFGSAIAAVLTDAAYTAAAQALGARVAEETRGSPVVDELEALVRQSRMGNGRKAA
ncbi:glycosyltransferase [Novosphingobium sp. G106]|uniref:glycosyltransferase n=1 Tax=Novosphingobium sp. G106 TaxID=2849500 RepID=UPI001C2DC01D|nr:glycosyltransferase [Novosphingobium sp. G106]MBV1690183.1 glycosyltransferase [Novosphingobium sp. G106]